METPAARAQRIGGLVLAAGEARRFGSPKQLALLGGRPLLEHALLAMARARSVDVAVVVLGAHAAAVRSAIDLHGAEPLVCADWAEGQSASLRAGVGALAERVEAIAVILGDQPLIDPRAIDRVVAARDGAAVALRASYGGRPGHPVLVERGLFGATMSLRGDLGARELLAGAAVRLVPCDGLGDDLDVDLREQLDGGLSAGGSSPPH